MPTASGATAVQSLNPWVARRRIVRYVGSARDEAELGLLVEQAQRLLADDAQRKLDLGITPKAQKAFPPPTGALFTGAGESRSRQLKWHVRGSCRSVGRVPSSGRTHIGYRTDGRPCAGPMVPDLQP